MVFLRNYLSDAGAANIGQEGSCQLIGQRPIIQ